jgi:hypothetical protein
VPELVIGEAVPLLERIPPAPVATVRPTLVTEPTPAATQLVTPVPSVDSTLVLLPAETGSVRVHAAEADALDWIVVARAATFVLARTREPAVVLCTPSVSAPPLIVALALPETVVPVAA